MKPKISVVMTAYNHADFLKESISSVLSQSFTDFELIIVNDQSIDKTENIIQSFKDNRIVYVKNKINLGTTKSTNLGFKKAKGEYVCILCSDDYFPQDSLEKRYNFIRNGGFEAIHTGLTRVESDKSKNYIKPFGNSENIVAFIKNKPQKTGLNVATFLYKSATLKKIGYLNTAENTKYNRDYELGLRTLLNCKTSELNENTYFYRIHQTNRSHSNWKKIEAQRNFKHIEHIYLKLFANS
jgi:glycosyltransferase involved in cell wall biosynthesis